MLRALIANNVLVDLIIINQSENIASKVIVQRVTARYPELLNVEVRKHPKFLGSLFSAKTKHKLFSSKWRSLAYYEWHLLLDIMFKRVNAINNAKECPPNFAQLINKCVKHRNYDAVWFNYLKAIPRNLNFKRHTIICDLHDLQVARIENDVIPKLPENQRAAYLAEFSASEKRMLNHCDIALTISPTEYAVIQQRYAPKTKLITLVATDDIHVSAGVTIKQDLLFVGSNSDANIAGLLWFLNNVLPEIIQHRPETTFFIQGNITRNPTLKENANLREFKNNITLGQFVPTVADIYQTANVVVCPILHGTGMKIKMIEAMSYGKAIVATSVAAEGIERSEGLNAYDNPSDFARVCVNALNDALYNQQLQQISRDTFALYYSFNSLKERIHLLLQQLSIVPA